MPMRKPGEDVGRGRRHHDLEEELELVEPQHLRDVAVVLRDVADADRGVDDDRPDRGDEDHEDRRRLAVAERRERERQPGERRHGAQHLEDRIEPAHRPGRLADQRAERDADDRRRAHSRRRRAAGSPTCARTGPCRCRRDRRTDRRSAPRCRSAPWTAAAAWRRPCGRAAPRPPACSASTTTGGTTCGDDRLASRQQRGSQTAFACGAIASTLAGAARATATAVSVLSTGMFISVLLQLEARRAAGRTSPAARLQPISARLIGEALEVGRRILRIEHLAVEEGLLAARGRGRDVGRRHAERLGGLAPDVLAVDLARSAPWRRSSASNLPQRMSSVMNQRSWLWNG